MVWKLAPIDECHLCPSYTENWHHTFCEAAKRKIKWNTEIPKWCPLETMKIKHKKRQKGKE